LPAYDAARSGAALIDRSDRGRLVVSGNDRASYLQGLLTNDIAALKPGDGCYSAYLTPQGRMITDLWVYELGDLILLTLGADVKDAVLAKLDQFIFSEDVQLGDVTDTFASAAVVGPGAARVVSAVLPGSSIDTLAALPDHGNVLSQFGGERAIVLRVVDAGQRGYEIFVGAEHFRALASSLRDAGVVEVDPDTAEVLRLEAGVPKFHRDMDETTIPLEAGLESTAISQTKGCYVGQEVIIRVLHRGHGRVARKLVGLMGNGEAVPPAGALVESAGREVGHVTSAVFSLALKKPIALAYIHRDFVDPGTEVVVDGAPAVVAALPFTG
jgi:folate-binding protein YgfZ